ncbi:phage tail protein [Pelotomaculum terephthalicicum JT]|uniref:phage tail protein n=1 Tax=Pelotomaculum terephthalicicum TaxID=206393 RepID=UPI001F042667|nr:phage tail protein [Pelotomaculum terephthalicicum]MCG9968444.1 phage tail protein [Pelotomaculum terephthalicicum JT]
MKAVAEQAGFFSLNKKSDWEKGCKINLEITDNGLALRKTNKYATSRVINLDALDAIAEVTDFTVGNNGQIYLLDGRANLFLYDYLNEQLDLFFGREQGYFTKNAAILFLRGTIYSADPFGENKVAAFAAATGQIYWILNNFNGLPLFPLAMTADEQRNVYILVPLADAGNNDDLEVPAEGLLGVVKISMTGKVVLVFQNEKFRLNHSDRIIDLLKKYFITVSKEGSVYVLNTEDNTVFEFSKDNVLKKQYSVPLPGKSSGFCVDSYDQIYIGESRKIGLNAEDDRFIHRFSSIGEFLEKIPGFRGRTDKFFLDQNNSIYIWNRETGTITILDLKPKVQEMSATGLPHGIYFSSSFDSTITEISWHKMILNADIPENTQLKVSYFSSDRKTLMINGKLTDIDEFINNDATPPDEKISSLEPFWSEPVVNPADALVHGARGRYFWLKIEFVGNEELTPVLSKFRLYYPRTSYLRYLPAIYQEDHQSRDFLERFLALFEAFFADMEENISNVARYFDVDAVSGPYLKWLATWLAISVDDSWTGEQLKQLIKKAPVLFEKRGTKQGMEEIIEIYTGEKPFIVEYFQYKHLREQPELKDLVAQLYGTDPYCFCVLIKQECVPTAGRRFVVQQIINQEKPAFTEAKMVVLQPWIYMDMHTYLGINTYLSELSLLRLDQESSIPYSTLITDVALDNRMGVHSRVGLDTELK